jgi:hypothetical protein
MTAQWSIRTIHDDRLKWPNQWQVQIKDTVETGHLTKNRIRLGDIIITPARSLPTSLSFGKVQSPIVVQALL